MVAAVVVTFTEAGFGNHFLLFGLAAVPAVGLGLYIAQSVNMTEMPQLVALSHSFVGLAAVMVSEFQQMWTETSIHPSPLGWTGELPLSRWCGARIFTLTPSRGLCWCLRRWCHLHGIW